MQKKLSFLAALIAVALLSAGCGGMERKLGRGINNFTEFTRGGEISRSIEQATLFDGRDAGYTAGLARGINRSFARTLIGASEIATFPIPTPTYDAYFFPDKWFEDPYTKVKAEKFTENPPRPYSYAPGPVADSILATDTNLGFGGGDIIPIMPGSRFRIFDR
ncbi:MAG: exosortase system-associated protein, TIGR04073 family [Verrucomicrobia bacterium]|nr:exosortase system-associated protein, TIGR04073 family [Verrucomicrobiota bacterium]